QTPLEFVSQVARRYPAVAGDARVLGDLYSRMAYGHERISSRWQKTLRQLWVSMRSCPAGTG
ncbi:MAG: DUF4129 domain-containing protein, partial [Planctomycetes bacterium]|nr:DUF4129 domain-containing protein [Planctomycetota bacterium]